jgi:hypothetical protein
MAYGCRIPLFIWQWEHQILVGSFDSLLGVGGHSHVQLGGLLHLLGCTIRCARGCQGVVWAPTSKTVHTSYRSGCGSRYTVPPRPSSMCSVPFYYTYFMLIILQIIWNLICSHGHLTKMMMPYRSPYWVIGGWRSRTSQAPLKGATWCTPTCLIVSPPDRYDNIYLYVKYLVILTSVEKLQVTWQPYEIDMVHGMALNDICRRDQDLWTIVVPLICYYIVEWHLPIRVVHQFGGLQNVVVQHESMIHSFHEYAIHYLFMCSMFEYKLVRQEHQHVVCFVRRINRRKIKGAVDWVA